MPSVKQHRSGMPNRERASVLIDCSSLRYLHTGLGQSTYFFSREIAAREAGQFDFYFLVYPSSRSLIGANPGKMVTVNWFRRHVAAGLQPSLFKTYDLWHVTSENSRITHFSPSSRVLLTLHGLHYLDEDAPEVAAVKLRQTQQLVNRCHGIATVSEYTANLVRKHIDLGTRPLKVIHHGVDDDRVREFKRPNGIPDGKFLFSIGSFFERKNFHVLLPFLKNLDGYGLVLAGDARRGYGEHIRSEIERLGLNHRVFLPGEVDEAGKNWLYRHCDAFVFPSLSEGFGIPVLEAMKAGKPVFCSRYGSLPEVGGDHAFYWEDFNPETMRELFMNKMEHVRQSPDWEERCRQYADQFTWKKAVDSYFAYYAEILR